MQYLYIFLLLTVLFTHFLHLFNGYVFLGLDFFVGFGVSNTVGSGVGSSVKFFSRFFIGNILLLKLLRTFKLVFYIYLYPLILWTACFALYQHLQHKTSVSIFLKNIIGNEILLKLSFVPCFLLYNLPYLTWCHL